MLRQIIFLFLFTKIYANSNNPAYLKLHCTFSKHMLTFFQLNEKYFLLSTKQNVENVTYMDHLKYYGENLKTQGVIVMSMLDELRTKGFKEFPADLMTVNLYLNNVMGHIYMYSDIEDIKGKRVISEEERLRQGFVINYGLIVNHLVKVLNEKCGSLSLYLIQLEKRFQFLSNISEECTKPFRTDDIQVIHNCLENLKTLASNTFHITVQRGSFSDYHPSNLLFFDLLNPYSKFNDQFVIDDGLNSMRMVRVKSHLNNEANIINLYETALFNFDGYYLKSFQQQVLVATLYPLLKVIITFLNMFTQMYENSFEDQFKDNITQRSVKIKSIISKLTHQNLYIYKINKYLNNISNDLSNIYYLSTYKPGWIYNLKSDIANIVTLNKLEINQEDTTTRYITKDDCLELLKNTQEEINMIEKYVDDLLLKKDVLLIVKDTINHNDILDIEPINVLNTRLTGSFNHYDENKLFSKPNPEDVKVNNRNRKKRGKTSKNNISKNKISNENQNEHTSCSDMTDNIHKHDFNTINFNENNNASNSLTNKINSKKDSEPNSNDFVVVNIINENEKSNQNNKILDKSNSSNDKAYKNTPGILSTNKNFNKGKNKVLDIINNINEKAMKNIKLNENNSNSSCQTDNKSTPNSPTDNLNSNKNKEQNSESYSKKEKSNGIISDLNEEKMQDANSNSSEKKSTVKDIISNINKKEMKDIKLNENNSNSSCQTDNKSTPSSPTDNIKSNRNKEQNSNSFNNNLNFSNIINDLNGKLMRDMIFDENCQYFNKQNYSESISNNTSNSVKNYKNEDQISSDPDKKSMVSDIINDLNKKSKKDVDQNNVNFENKSVTKNSLSNFNSSIINSELEQKNSVDSTNKSSVLHIISNLNERSKNDKNNLEIKGSTKGSKKDSNDKSIGLSTIKKTSKDNEKNNHILNKNHRFSKTNKPVESNQMARVKKFNSVKKTNNDDDIESIIGQSNYNELGIDCRLDRHYNLTNSKSNDVRAPKEPMKIFPTRKNKPTGSHVSRLLDIYNELVENQFKNQNETLEKPNSDSYSSKTKNVLNQVNNIEKILKKLQNKKPNRDFGSTNKLLEDNNSQKIVISLNKPMKKNKDATSLNCLFIKFTLKFLQLNEQLFLTRHSRNGIETFTSDNLINYDSNLQFQSEYILAMLDELRTVQSDIFASELMSVNLYINNLQGKLKIDSLKNNNIQLKRKEFINNYKMINERLSKFTNLKCQTLKEPNIDERFKDLKCYVDQISRIEITSLSTKKIIESLQLLKYHSFSTFKKSLDNGTYHDFHPTNILFYDLMTGSAAFDVSTNFYAFKETNERLNSLREVVLSVNNNVEIKNTIVELFYCASSNYNAEYAKSFQQQVLAATVYPVFKCISHYLLAFKKIYCDRNTPMKSTEAMINIGTSMRYNVKTFIELDLFANKPTEYLINMFDKFNDILNKTTNDTIKFMQPEKVSELLLMCTKPMQLNQLEFNVDDKFSNILSKNIYKTVIQEINNEVNEISKYIQSLTLHENLFKIIKRSIPHEDIFETQPLNFMQKCILDRINNNGEENK